MANNRNTSIEFIVKPKQDLHLQGQLRKLHRIDKGEAYPCQMQKNQNFSCLFRHYAKHNGLKKEDLIFSFVDELLPEQTPETVHLMPGDEIWVEHRAAEEKEDKHTPSVTQFGQQFRALFESGQHSDITFVVGEEETHIPAHKAVICARSYYFAAMFRVGGMVESTQGTVTYPQQHTPTFRRMLEFLYSDNIEDLPSCSPAEVALLLDMANEYVLKELRELSEKFAAKQVNRDNVAKFLLITADEPASVLRAACVKYVQENVTELAADFKFRQEVEKSPELGLFLFEASVPIQMSENSQDSFDMNKRRRISGGGVESVGGGNGLHHLGGAAGGSDVVALDASAIVPAGTNNVGANTIAQTNVNVND